MVRCFVLGALKVVHRVMKEIVVIAAIVEARDPNGLLTPMLLLFSTDHVDFAPHFDRAVESID